MRLQGKDKGNHDGQEEKLEWEIRTRVERKIKHSGQMERSNGSVRKKDGRKQGEREGDTEEGREGHRNK